MERKDLMALLIGLLMIALFFWVMFAITSKPQAKTLPDPVCGRGLHVGNPHCITPLPTRIVLPTATPTLEPTIEPTVVPIEPTEIPEATPEATIVPVEPVKTVVQTFTPALTTPKCEEMVPTKVNDVWYSDYEVSNGKASILLHWGLNDAYKNVNIVYGHKPLEWEYGVPLTENSGSLRIGELEPYTTYWFQVAYVTDSCGIGQHSEPIDP